MINGTKKVVGLLHLVVLMFITTADVYADTPQPDIQQLITDVRVTIKDRLLAMSPVARYKWDNQLPVEDLTREKKVIENTVSQATAAGLESAYAVQVITAQMNAAKQIQLGWFQRWQLSPGTEKIVPLKDLNTEIRPAISAITKRLISHLNSLEATGLTCQHVAQLLEVPPSIKAYSQAWETAAKSLVPSGLNCL